MNMKQYAHLIIQFLYKPNQYDQLIIELIDKLNLI